MRGVKLHGRPFQLDYPVWLWPLNYSEPRTHILTPRPAVSTDSISNYPIACKYNLSTVLNIDAHCTGFEEIIRGSKIWAGACLMRNI